jgi:hypothetical protein
LPGFIGQGYDAVMAARPQIQAVKHFRKYVPGIRPIEGHDIIGTAVCQALGSLEAAQIEFENPGAVMYDARSADGRELAKPKSSSSVPPKR